jgi:hypothetical protein
VGHASVRAATADNAIIVLRNIFSSRHEYLEVDNGGNDRWFRSTGGSEAIVGVDGEMHHADRAFAQRKTPGSFLPGVSLVFQVFRDQKLR